MPDFDAYIEEAIEVVIKLRDKDVDSEHPYIDEARHTGWIYGLRRAKNLFTIYEQQTRVNMEILSLTFDEQGDGLWVEHSSGDITSDHYWDCECDEDFIHYKGNTVHCNKCDRHENDMPDSRLIEVQDMLILQKDKARGNLLKCPHIESTKFLCDRDASYQVNGTVYCQIHAKRLLLEKTTVDKGKRND